MTETETLDTQRNHPTPRAAEPSTWFIPPVVIPAVVVLLILATATSRALA